jgi:hypothetical protein
MPLYQSVSENLYDAGFTQQHSNTLAVRYVYQKQLVPNLYLDFRFEPQFDLNNFDTQLQFIHSLFITYKENAKLFNCK